MEEVKAFNDAEDFEIHVFLLDLIHFTLFPATHGIPTGTAGIPLSIRS